MTKEDVEVRLASLTPRERDVLSLVLDGLLNKQIAYDLGVSERTIKAHRSRVMEKMGTKSVVRLARMCFALHQIESSPNISKSKVA